MRLLHRLLTTDYYRLLTNETTSQPMVIQKELKIKVKFKKKLLGMIVAKGKNKLWVDTINKEELKKKI